MSSNILAKLGVSSRTEAAAIALRQLQLDNSTMARRRSRLPWPRDASPARRRSADREELRTRYQMLLQELRVVLPGVQVLMAFLQTAPFAQRFGDLDDLGRGR